MRLWSLHPMYLDTRGLTAVWREALLARKVLQGRTAGYRRHPQLIRFRECGRPIGAINLFLKQIYQEAVRREFGFDRAKLGRPDPRVRITVTRGQADFECRHLMDKLKKRDPEKYRFLSRISRPRLNPLFRMKPGGRADWEKA